MARKDKDVSVQLTEAAVREANRKVSLRERARHIRMRDKIEFEEENPRDHVYETVNPVTGETTPHRVPLRAFRLDKAGHEVLDPVPVAPPVTTRPLSTFEQIKLFNQQQSMMDDWPDASLEDEDNFEIPDDPVEINTQWEMNFEVAPVSEVFRRAREVVQERKRAQKPDSDPSRAPQAPGSTLDGPKPTTGSKPPSDPV